MNQKLITLSLILFAALAVSSLYYAASPNSGNPETVADNMLNNGEKLVKADYAWVTVIVSGAEAVFEDSSGKKTGFNKATNVNFEEIEDSIYITEYTPGEKIEAGGYRVFQAKVSDDFSYEVEFFGEPNTVYSYDYSLSGVGASEIQDRIVGADLTFDSTGRAKTRFSYTFLN